MQVCSMMPVVVTTKESLQDTINFYHTIGFVTAYDSGNDGRVLTNRGHYILIINREDLKISLSIQVADIQESYREITSLRGIKVVQEITTIGSSTYYFMVQDPAGNIVLIQELGED